MSGKIKYITDIPDLEGKRVLLRASLNVPIKDGMLVDDFRISRALETIEFLKEKGARTIIISHIGRDPKETLRSVYNHMSKKIELVFVEEVVGDEVEKSISKMKNGDVILLENLRSNTGETINDIQFAEKLASHADLYINDAFAVAHRAHASLVGIPRFLPSYAGLLFKSEYKNLSRAISPARPALFILGGAKFSTKQPLVEKFVEIYDHVFIGGALVNDFYKARGWEVGRSKTSEFPVKLEHLLENPKIVLPIDITVISPDGKSSNKKPNEVKPDEMIIDSGPETLKNLETLIKKSSFVLWNGPLGDYKMGFRESTERVANIINDNNVPAVVGGGDTVALIHAAGLVDSFVFSSTAGGAMLEFLLAGTLPAIEALQASTK